MEILSVQPVCQVNGIHLLFHHHLCIYLRRMDVGMAQHLACRIDVAPAVSSYIVKYSLKLGGFLNFCQQQQQTSPVDDE